MRKADVVIGKTYVVKVSGKLAPVQLTQLSNYGGGWWGTNLCTGRQIRIRSAAKLRKEYVTQPLKPRDLAAEIVGPLNTGREN